MTGLDRRVFLQSAAAVVLGATAAPAAPQEEPRYPSVGPGHFVKENRERGRFIVLEDKSVWEISERNRHVTVEWQELEGISVRLADGEPPFRYEISNVDRDEGAAARWVRPTG